MKKKNMMALMLCAVMAASTVLTGCGGKSDSAGTQAAGESTGAGSQGGALEDSDGSDPVVYKRLYSSESSTLNYLVTSTIEEQRVGANCIDTLVEYDSDGQLKEGLATEWNYDEASMTWTFKLPSGLTIPAQKWQT